MFDKNFLASPAGVAALAYSEDLYSSTFKGAEFTLASQPEMYDELVRFHMEPTYAREPVQASSFHDDDSLMGDDDHEEDDSICINDYSGPDPIEISPGMSLVEAQAAVLTSTYVWLCNYKGEGEGFTLKEHAAHLSTFIAKYEYVKE